MLKFKYQSGWLKINAPEDVIFLKGDNEFRGMGKNNVLFVAAKVS